MYNDKANQKPSMIINMAKTTKLGARRLSLKLIGERLARLVLPLACLLAACGGAPGVPICTDSLTPQTVGQFCAPTTIAAGQALRLQVREQCGGCTQSATRCEAVVQGLELKLRLLGQSCTLPPNYACPAICAINTFDCSVPPLAAGTYRVTAESGSAAAVMMTADPTVSATSCTVQSP